MKICIAINIYKIIFSIYIEISFFHTLYSDHFLSLTSSRASQLPTYPAPYLFSLFSKQKGKEKIFIIFNIRKNYHKFINSNF